MKRISADRAVSTYNLFAVCGPGLEPITRRELDQLGLAATFLSLPICPARQAGWNVEVPCAISIAPISICAPPAGCWSGSERFMQPPSLNSAGRRAGCPGRRFLRPDSLWCSGSPVTDRASIIRVLSLNALLEPSPTD